MASGGTGDGAGNIGTILLLNLFRERLGVEAPTGNGAKTAK